MEDKIDILAFGAHPDDIEIGMGGTIAKYTSLGKKVVVIDFSRGEMGTRGSVEERKTEADSATEKLGLTLRKNLNLPDGKLNPSDEFVEAAVREIRIYKPKIIFAPYMNDRHPDHIGVSTIVKQAHFFSGVGGYKTYNNSMEQDRYRASYLFYYQQTYEFSPTFLIDISNHFNTKMNSVLAYKTQFYNPKSEQPETFISSPNFLEFLESRAKNYGFKIGKRYAEAFFSETQIELNLSDIL